MKRNIALSLAVSMLIALVAWVVDAAAGNPNSFRSGSRATREETPTYRTPTPDDDSPSLPSESPPVVKKPKKPQSWRRMMRGLLTGGLIGSIFYGRGFARVGLLEIVILSGLIVLAFRALSRYQAGAQASLATAGAPSGAALMIGSPPVEPLRVEDERDALEHRLAEIRGADAAFDPADFARTVERIFRRVQSAWTERDIGQAAEVLTLQMRDRLEGEIARLHALGHVNRVEAITVRRVSIVGAKQDRGWDRVVVQIVASLIDYTTNQSGLKVLEGNPFEPVPFSECWELVRPSGPNPWRLNAIQ